MVCRKTAVIPFECVVRGYLEGSGWREYQETGVVCGVRLPKGLQQCDRLPSPIFTPATKAAEGHDENVTFEFMTQQLGSSLAERLKDQSLEIYQRAAELAAVRGILIADTKFEWGLVQDQLLLIDEALTPDSSRFWPADQYRPGKAQPSFDKQFVREWLMSTDWDRNSPPPRLPLSIVQQTREKYLDALNRLTKKMAIGSKQSVLQMENHGKAQPTRSQQGIRTDESGLDF
jgi:phosphoribosylaminoimidazole-succinocarboxamide synthase